MRGGDSATEVAGLVSGGVLVVEGTAVRGGGCEEAAGRRALDCVEVWGRLLLPGEENRFCRCLGQRVILTVSSPSGEGVQSVRIQERHSIAPGRIALAREDMIEMIDRTIERQLIFYTIAACWSSLPA